MQQPPALTVENFPKGANEDANKDANICKLSNQKRMESWMNTEVITPKAINPLTENQLLERSKILLIAELDSINTGNNHIKKEINYYKQYVAQFMLHSSNAQHIRKIIRQLQESS